LWILIVKELLYSVLINPISTIFRETIHVYAQLYQSIFLEIIRYSLLDKIIMCMAEDWKKRDISDKYTMTRMAYMSRWFSNVIIISNATSVILYATGTLLRHKSVNQTDARELILKMELPFEMESISVYIVILVIQFIHQTTAASMVAVLNSLLITLVSPSVIFFHYLPMFLKKNICDIIQGMFRNIIT
jgi:hypothetical protein